MIRQKFVANSVDIPKTQKTQKTQKHKNDVKTTVNRKILKTGKTETGVSTENKEENNSNSLLD